MLKRSFLLRALELATVHSKEIAGNVILPLKNKRNSARQDVQTVMATIWLVPIGIDLGGCEKYIVEIELVASGDRP